MKIYLLVGETSGDVHGTDLVKAIVEKYPESQIRAMGGPLMKEAGAEIAFDYREYAIMGFVEVLKKLPSIKKHLSNVAKDIIAFDPDHVIMIDYSGFNLNIAKKLHPRFPLHYYIAPKAWAWNAKRSLKLAKYFDTVSCILPFEVAFFQDYNVPVKYVGNPSKAQVQHYLSENEIVNDQEDYIALFPGSRKQEIERILPIMLEAIREIPSIKYKISQAPSLPKSLYLPYLKKDEDLVMENYQLLSKAKAALVTSGTATLETCLFNIPQVVCYVANPISYAIGKFLVKIKYISLVNLIADKEVVRELIQHECNPTRIREELLAVLDGNQREQMLKEYKNIELILGEEYPAENVVNQIGL